MLPFPFFSRMRKNTPLSRPNLLSLVDDDMARFSGLVRNVDGAGRSASDNDTLYVYVWTAIQHTATSHAPQLIVVKPGLQLRRTQGP